MLFCNLLCKSYAVIGIFSWIYMSIWWRGPFLVLALSCFNVIPVRFCIGKSALKEYLLHSICNWESDFFLLTHYKPQRKSYVHPRIEKENTIKLTVELCQIVVVSVCIGKRIIMSFQLAYITFTLQK